MKVVISFRLSCWLQLQCSNSDLPMTDARSCTCRCQEEKPLEFEDIVDKMTYDKMRPPKPGGEKKVSFLSLLLQQSQFLDLVSLSFKSGEEQKKSFHFYYQTFGLCHSITLHSMTFWSWPDTVSFSLTLKGKATDVSFHVTVMSLDTIDEGSMVGTCTESRWSVWLVQFLLQQMILFLS